MALPDVNRQLSAKDSSSIQKEKGPGKKLGPFTVFLAQEAAVVGLAVLAGPLIPGFGKKRAEKVNTAVYTGGKVSGLDIKAHRRAEKAEAKKIEQQEKKKLELRRQADLQKIREQQAARQRKIDEAQRVKNQKAEAKARQAAQRKEDAAQARADAARQKREQALYAQQAAQAQKREAAAQARAAAIKEKNRVEAQQRAAITEAFPHGTSKKTLKYYQKRGRIPGQG